MVDYVNTINPGSIADDRGVYFIMVVRSSSYFSFNSPTLARLRCFILRLFGAKLARGCKFDPQPDLPILGKS